MVMASSRLSACLSSNKKYFVNQFPAYITNKKREKPKQAIPAYRGELVQKFLPAQHKIQCCQVYANVFGSTLLPLRIIIIQIHSFGKHKKNCKQEKKYLVALHVGCNIT